MTGGGETPRDEAGDRRRLLARWAAWLALILALLIVLLPVPGVIETPDGDLVAAPCGSVVDPVEHEQDPWASEGCHEVRAPLRTGALLLVGLAVGTGVVLRRSES